MPPLPPDFADGISAREEMTASISMIGFAANPGTDVLPTCSTEGATLRRASQIGVCKVANVKGHEES